MDPRLFDTVWEVYRQVGSSEPIHINSAYRSPGTNAMLRRRSKRGGRVQPAHARQGDGLLPAGRSDRPHPRGRHADAARRRRLLSECRHAVRASRRRQRARLAAHDAAISSPASSPTARPSICPADGRPLPGYEEAKAEVLAQGGTVAGHTAVCRCRRGVYRGRAQELLGDPVRRRRRRGHRILLDEPRPPRGRLCARRQQQRRRRRARSVRAVPAGAAATGGAAARRRRGSGARRGGRAADAEGGRR